MPCLKLKNGTECFHPSDSEIFFKSLVKVEWRYSCIAILLGFFKTQTYTQIHALLKDLAFLMTHMEVLNPDTSHHLGQFRRQK